MIRYIGKRVLKLIPGFAGCDSDFVFCYTFDARRSG